MHTTYDMVFEGGGAKGSAFVGALEEFFGAGLRPRRLIGTSAGAIAATLLAAGYTPPELLAAMGERDPKTRARASPRNGPPTGDQLSEEERETAPRDARGVQFRAAEHRRARPALLRGC